MHINSLALYVLIPWILKKRPFALLKREAMMIRQTLRRFEQSSRLFSFLKNVGSFDGWREQGVVESNLQKICM